jgi:hypothetical protein
MLSSSRTGLLHAKYAQAIDRGSLRQCERFAWARRWQLPAIVLLERVVTRTQFVAVDDAARADSDVLPIQRTMACAFASRFIGQSRAMPAARANSR